MANKTVGEANAEAAAAPPIDASYIDIQREVHKNDSYEKEVLEALNRGLKDPAIKGDFYIVVLFRRDRLLAHVIRQMFFYRQSCPTPQYDQTVYCYHRKEDYIEFLWVVPSNVACLNLPLYEHTIDPDQLELVQMVKDFRTGKLDRIAQIRNKEVEILH